MTASAQIAAAERGSAWEQFAPLYDEHHEHLYRVALLLCHGDRAAAEDATAEAFIKVHTAWAEGRVEQFFPYARQTLVNHVIGQARRQQVAHSLMTRSEPRKPRAFRRRQSSAPFRQPRRPLIVEHWQIQVQRT